MMLCTRFSLEEGEQVELVGILSHFAFHSNSFFFFSFKIQEGRVWWGGGMLLPGPAGLSAGFVPRLPRPFV